MSTEFSLDRFESQIQSRDYDAAHEEFCTLLRTLSDKRGRLGAEHFARSTPNAPSDEKSRDTLQRIADGFTTLFSAPEYPLQAEKMNIMFWGRPWINMIFAVTSYGSTDHIVRKLLETAEDNDEARAILTRKQLVLYTAGSQYDIDFTDLHRRDPVLATSLGVSMVSAAVHISPAAHEKRERLLEWLPGALDKIEDLDELPTAAVCGAYMHCSYSTSPERHEIKRSINRLVRKKLDALGLLGHEASVARTGIKGRKPVMLVVLEWFSGGHSIYRTHSRTMLAARQHFEVVAFGEAQNVDEAGRAIFDRFVEFEHPEYVGDCIRQIQAFAAREQPDVLYMPSVGMFSHTIFLSNLRVAPLQIAGLGHPATMHAAHMDYVSVEDDFVGDPACFSEKMLRLPKDGQPYVPSKLLTNVVPSVPERGDVVNIGVTASAMKINPHFLETCQAIVRTARVPVKFHFMTCWNESIDLAYVRKSIYATLPESSVDVYGSLSYPEYLKILNTMDMFVSPFPFGNTNGIVDSFTMGLPGVNLCGREVFEHIDSGLFERAGLPSWLTTYSTDEYVRAAARLAEQHDEREALRRRLIDGKAVERIFEGRPEAFGEGVLKLLNGLGEK
ncbi:adhesin [Paraburkholderia phytofirmans]|uniref:Putative adhesin processing HmwC-like protein n=1 Tax=Paraburkholderia phytofirmans (strain DSM 17436 / LMG 22146 / PsJN) TaxID=398527 RepID=B2TFA9_PARPJ|nr:adhesin [Paraburkholderia phytofirmans]ACD18780.1 putative adhesin processing HmwC-like protein [Paraburkholderia phytofirmans PsJN]